MHILGVGLQVLGQVDDALSQHGNLHNSTVTTADGEDPMRVKCVLQVIVK